MFHHNLLACNTGRNPSIAMSYDFNFVNNVLFNWRHRTVDGGDSNSVFNIINNYYKPGPVTPDSPVRYRILEPAQSWTKADPISADERVINETRTGKVWSEGKEFTPPPMKGLAKNNIGTAGNGIITDISQVGGWPEYKGEPIKDLGPDGIPLTWKKQFGLDANDPALAQKVLQGDGYTVMDKYLDGLDPTKKIDWSDPKSNVNTLK